MALAIVCPVCGEEYRLDNLEWVCIRCGGHLEIEGVPQFDPALNGAVASLWRDRHFLPLPEGAEPVTLGEGWTPLIRIRARGRDLLGKFEFLNPSGSFKDRGSTVMVSALKALALGSLGIARLVEDSSGNAAASLAAYAARAGLRAQIFVPAHTTSNKLLQTEAYGAEIKRVEGPRENAGKAAQGAVAAGGAYYASHYYNPFAMFGMQTAAWELWEQLGGKAPDNIVLPVGHGTHLIGLYRGFQRLQVGGYIDRPPHLFAAQAANISPLATAFTSGSTEPAPVAPNRTIAEGIAISRPVRGTEILRAIRDTGGAALAVSEDEIRAAQSELSHQGILVEPTSATALAALDRIRDLQGTTVISLTGSGLKSLGVVT